MKALWRKFKNRKGIVRDRFLHKSWGIIVNYEEDFDAPRYDNG